jgi:hypothetical protein
VKRFFEDFQYQAASWDKPLRVIAMIEWHPDELFPRVGFIVTNLLIASDWVVRFYNQRGTAEQHIKEGKYAFIWTRLSCKGFRDRCVCRAEKPHYRAGTTRVRGLIYPTQGGLTTEDAIQNANT